jgi:hypothetical protein
MDLDLGIPGYSIRAADKGQCSGVHLAYGADQPQIGHCPTNPIFAIYKDGSEDADYRCWKHFREFLGQHSNAVADIIIQLLLQQQAAR